MERLIVEVKNSNDLTEIEKLGTVIWESLILNMIGLELPRNKIEKLAKVESVISFEYEPIGNIFKRNDDE